MKKESTSRNGTSALVIVLALAVGFLSGIAFSAWKMKSISGHSASSASAQSGKLNAMAEALEAQLRKEPNNPALLVRLGNTYFDTDQYTKAIEAYEKALTISPGNPNVLTDLGIMYRRAGQPEKAIAAFDTAIAANPKHSNAYLNKGIVLVYDLNRREEALSTWEALREINPLAMAGNQSIDELINHFKEGHDKEGKK
ncbi:MAG: tetratricopeptide repeat protein [Desulfobacterales bacterium]|nr:tetratricopeptide repeat protein [Desulfobacterales bacterium]